MVMYRRINKTMNLNEPTDDLVPEYIRNLISEAEMREEEEKKLKERKQKEFELDCWTSDGVVTKVVVSKTDMVADAVNKCYQAIYNSDKSTECNGSLSSISLQDVLLRKCSVYNTGASFVFPGEYLDISEKLNLDQLNIE